MRREPRHIEPGCGRSAAAGRLAAAVCGLALLGAAVVPALAAAPAATDSTASGAAAELRRAVRLATRTSPDSLTVGDRMTLEVIADVPAGCEVRFPDRIEHGAPVDLVDLTVQPPGGGKRQGQSGRSASGPNTWIGRYTLGVFAVGDVVLPPWPVEVRRGSDSAIASTDSIRFFVHSVLTDSLRQAGLEDLEPQVKLRAIPWWWIAAGAAVVALVVWLVLRRRRRPRAAVVPIERIRPAHEVALEALRKLENERLPLDGKFEAYHVRLSEILRRYLEDGFGVAALEETTEEILFDLDRHGFDRATMKQVAALCNESDLVKFAKHVPTVEECMSSISRVRDFVIGTVARSSLSRTAPAASSTGTLGDGATPQADATPRAGAGGGGT